MIEISFSDVRKIMLREKYLFIVLDVQLEIIH